jgi:DNA-binding transcriptional MocR family regulator
MDPRADYTAEDRAEQDRVVGQLYEMLERLTYVVDAILGVQAQATQRADRLADAQGLRDEVRSLHDEFEAFRKSLVATRKGGFIAGEEQLREKLGQLYGAVNGYEGRPTESQVKYMSVLDGGLKTAEERLDQELTRRMDALNEKLRAAGIEPLAITTREQWRAKRDAE